MVRGSVRRSWVLTRKKEWVLVLSGDDDDRSGIILESEGVYRWMVVLVVAVVRGDRGW